MDFSQHNKINSYLPPRIRKRTDYYPNNSISIPIPKNCPSKKCQNQSNFMHQSSNYIQQHHPSLMQPQTESSNRNCAHKMTKNFEPYSFNSALTENFCSMPSTSFFNNESNSGHEQPTFEQETSDFNVEFVQCLPQKLSRKFAGNKLSNQFKPLMNTMRKYNENHVKNIQCVGDTANNQTYCYSYKNFPCDEELKETDENVEHFYKSFTKIVSIPNGVQIITEIKTDNNLDEESGSKWLNKQIEVTLNDVNETTDVEDGNGNFCEDGKKN